ncbi:MAG: PIN domain-containing protein [Planctomycetota bacterium]
MKGRIFLDTNVVVYLFDRDAEEKRRRAREILEREGSLGRLAISTQVLQEFYVAVTRKLAEPLDPAAAYEAVQDLMALPMIQVDPTLILGAITRSRSDALSFRDSLIIQSALAAGSSRLYSEDLQDGRVIDGMTIENPFL